MVIAEWWEEFSSAWLTGWNDIKTAWTEFRDNWTTGWNDIKLKWDDFWDSWHTGLDVIKDTVNAIIRTMNKIPGIDIPEVGVSVPQMARGGIVDRPLFAEIGEAGKEAVVPLENDRAGLRELARALRDEMGAYQAPAQAQSAGGVTINMQQSISSPKALSEYEVWRQTRNMLSLIKAKGV